MKKVLITGSSGYIGGTLLQEALARSLGSRVVLGLRDLDPVRREFFVSQFPEVDIRHFDVLDPKTIVSALDGVDSVVHLASMNDQECRNDPKLANETNHLGTVRLLDGCLKNNVQRFVFFSTFHVYEKNGLIDENSPIKHFPDDRSFDQTAYAKTHYLAEKRVFQAHSENKINATILRLSNAVGAPFYPWTKFWTLVVGDLCKHVIQNQKIPLSSTGMQKRNFIAIKDVASAVWDILEKDKNWKNSSPIFNLGGPDSIAIIDLAKKIQDHAHHLFGFIPPIEVHEGNEETHPDFTYSSSKIISNGFQYRHTVDDAIKETLVFAKNHFSLLNRHKETQI